ncbi:MAG TPA: hypothetical protein VKS60_03050 [Stellaceae bacterium]|nr:hypothetical protein [Stellaceae bacterium]
MPEAADQLSPASWRRLAIVGGALAVAKGLRLPLLWAATQAQVDYSEGVVKRGLLGTINRALHLSLEHYISFYAFSYMVFVVLAALVLRRLGRVGLSGTSGGAAVVALFAASFGLTYLVNLIGYLDIILLLLAVVVLEIRHPLGQPAAALVLGVVACFFHEIYAIAFFPVTLLPVALRYAKGERAWAPLALAGAAVAAVLATAIFLAAAQPLDADAVARLQGGVLRRVDFPIRSDFFPVFLRSGTENLRETIALMGQSAWWIDQACAALAFLPTTACFVWVALRIAKSIYPGPAGRLARLAILVASASPLLMNVLGWDIYRWYAYTVIEAFLALTVVAEASGGSSFALRGREVVAVLVLISLNLATSVGLISEDQAPTFPYKSEVQEVVDHGIRGLIHAPDL